MPDLHLFHLPGSCSRVTMAALELAGAKYEVTVPRHHKGELATPAYRKINPFGQAPALLIDGVAYTENVALLWTLSRLFPAAAILPSHDLLTEARGLSRISTCSSGLHPIMTRIMFPQVFCDASPEAAARVRQQALDLMSARLAAIEPMFEGQTWWVNDTFSIADIYLSWITNRVRRLGLDFSAWPSLSAHVDRARDAPAMRRVRERDAGYVAELEAEGAVFPEHMRPTMVD